MPLCLLFSFSPSPPSNSSSTNISSDTVCSLIASPSQVLGCVFVPGHSSGENLRGVVQSADWSALSGQHPSTLALVLLAVTKLT
eukprot:3415034-Rhodomonas_salina.4